MERNDYEANDDGARVDDRLERALAAGDRHEVLAEIARTATLALFEAYGVSLTPATAAPTPLSLAGVIGFTGETARGTLMLGMSAGALDRARLTGAERPHDWIGELANQLLGRIKNQLLRLGVEVYLSTPLVIRGERLSKDGDGPLRFASGDEIVCVWLDHEIAPELVFKPVAEEMASEGDLVMF